MVQQEFDAFLYRCYISDTIMNINNSITGNINNKRYYELVTNENEKDGDNRTGDEIVLDVIKKAGLVLL